MEAISLFMSEPQKHHWGGHKGPPKVKGEEQRNGHAKSLVPHSFHLGSHKGLPSFKGKEVDSS